jgi:ATP adenylyltransferase
MQRLWAPWRKYITHQKTKGCIFCQKPKSGNDAENLVLERGRKAFVMLNLYPYNNGHLLVSPYRHLSKLTLMTPEESAEIFSTAQKMIRKLDKLLKPHGYNIGFNIGRAAGAGYDKHVHLHIVPRWTGDTNFMPVIAGDKVISESLQDLRKQLLDTR